MAKLRMCCGEPTTWNSNKSAGQKRKNDKDAASDSAGRRMKRRKQDKDAASDSQDDARALDASTSHGASNSHGRADAVREWAVEGHAAIGSRVVKVFDGVPYLGQVVGWRAARVDGEEELWMVVYCDSDTDEMEKDELRATVLAALHSNHKPKRMAKMQKMLVVRVEEWLRKSKKDAAGLEPTPKGRWDKQPTHKQPTHKQPTCKQPTRVSISLVSYIFFCVAPRELLEEGVSALLCCVLCVVCRDCCIMCRDSCIMSSLLPCHVCGT